MYTDGETFYYRNDRPTRPPVRPPAAPGSYEGSRYVEAALTDRLARLEAALERLEGAITQLEGLVQHAGPTHPEPLVRVNAVAPAVAEGTEEPVLAAAPPLPVARVLRMEHLAAEPPPPPAPLPEVKVSLYAGGGTTAILGHVKVQQDGE